MEQFLTGDVWKQVKKHIVKRQRKTACIAYVTLENLHLSKGDTLICDASEYEIKFGATSAKVLSSYFKKGVLIYSNPNLHSKLLLTNSFLVIGSANLSNKSAGELVESAILTDSDILLSQSKSFCHNLKREKETELLTRKNIDKLLKIKVVRRAFKPTSKSKTRNKKFGNRFWYITVVEMTDKALENVKDKLDHSIKQVTAKTAFSEDDVHTIYFGQKRRIGSLAKEGDQILIFWRNRNNTRQYIYPFATILRIDRKKEETIFVYDDTKGDDEYSFSKFKAMIKKIDLEKPLDKPRDKELSANDAKKLKALWK